MKRSSLPLAIRVAALTVLATLTSWAAEDPVTVPSPVSGRGMSAKAGEPGRFNFCVVRRNDPPAALSVLSGDSGTADAGADLGLVRACRRTAPESAMVPDAATFRLDLPGNFRRMNRSPVSFSSLVSSGVFQVRRLPDGVVDSGQRIELAEGRPPVDEDAESAANEAEIAALFAVAPKADPKLAGHPGGLQGERGKQVYFSLCYACHQSDGRGLRGAFPPLARSDFLLADRERAIRIVLKGLAGPVTVNGFTITSAMPPQEAVLTDTQVADVLTFVYNAWGNQGEPFRAHHVKAIRDKKD
jgi:mono/diheme cytochrome c family protein